MSDVEKHGTENSEPIADFFNYGALQVLGALEGKTAEEMAISLLEEEKEMRDNKIKEREKEYGDN